MLLELWKLHGSFASRFLMRKRKLLASGALEAPQLIFINIFMEKSIDFLSLELCKIYKSFLSSFPIEKSIGFLPLELWKFDSSFLLRF